MFNAGRLVRYMLVLVDKGSRFKWVYFMSRKSEAADILRAHFTKHGAPSSILSDNALELTSTSMNAIKREFNIVQWTTCVNTSEQNPAERAIRAILEKSSTIAANTNIDPTFGWTALAWIAANMLNVAPQLDREGAPSAYEQRFGQPWSFTMDRVPGARAFVHVRHASKFSLHAIPCLYLGRAEGSMLKTGFVVLLVETGKLVVSRSVYVQENTFPVFHSSVYKSQQDDLLIHVDVDESTTPASRVDGAAPPVPPPPAAEPSPQAPDPADASNADGDDDARSIPTPTRSGARDEAARPLLARPLPAPPALDAIPEHDEPPAAQTADPPATRALPALRFIPSKPLTDGLPSANTRSARRRAANTDDHHPSSSIAAAAPAADAATAAAAPTRLITASDYFGVTAAAAAADGAVGTMTHSIPTPKNYKEAMSSPWWSQWKVSIRDEFSNLKDLGVFEETSTIDPDEIILTGMWAFKVKNDGRLRARLAARGFAAGRMPISEVFSPTINTSSLLILLALASIYKARLGSFDVVSAFMHGKMEGRRNRYVMRLPPGYVPSKPGVRYLRIVGSINGLKEASQVWDEHLRGILTSIGFRPTRCDPALYVRAFPDGSFIIVPVHVDDGLVIYTTTDDCFDKFKHELSAKLNERIKWGAADEYLSMDLEQSNDRSSITVSMSSYINSVLPDYDPDCNLRVRDTPASADILNRTNSDTSRLLDAKEKSLYFSAVGTLNYIRKVRCDIEFPVTLLASKLQAPTKYNWSCVLHVFGYLKGTISLGRCFNGDPVLRGMSDADFGNTPDGRSYSGILVMLGGSAIVARTRKQTTVTTSTADSELLSL